MEVKDLNLCKLMEDSSFGGFSRIVLMLKDALVRTGELPKKCPVLKGTKFDFDMMNMDPQNFPFLPEMNFKFVQFYTLDSIPKAFVVNITGQVVNRRRSKTIF